MVLCSSEFGGVSGLGAGKHRFIIMIPIELLQPGIYRIEGAVWNADEVFDQDDNLGYFQLMSENLNPMHGRTSSAQYVSPEPWIELP